MTRDNDTFEEDMEDGEERNLGGSATRAKECRGISDAGRGSLVYVHSIEASGETA